MLVIIFIFWGANRTRILFTVDGSEIRRSTVDRIFEAGDHCFLTRESLCKPLYLPLKMCVCVCFLLTFSDSHKELPPSRHTPTVEFHLSPLEMLGALLNKNLWCVFSSACIIPTSTFGPQKPMEK